MEIPQNIFTRRQYIAEQHRYIGRNQAIQRSRKSGKQLSYLKQYPKDLQKAILRSMQQAIPSQLPKLQISTISYYRRDYTSVFKTHPDGTRQLDPHMTFQSLWMLSGMQQDKFQDFEQISKQFQQNLSKYLDMGFPEIRKFAIVAAGNKILGLQGDILRIVQQEPSEVWVLINHVYAEYIQCKYLYKFLGTSTISNDEIILRAIFQLTNNPVDNKIIHSLSDYPEAIPKLITYIRQTQNQQIRTMSLRIIGNILTEAKFTQIFLKQNLLGAFFELLKVSNQEIIKDVCWALANFISQSTYADFIFQHENYLEKLVDMFLTESSKKIQNELVFIVRHLVIYSNQNQTYKLFQNQKLIQRCVQLLDTYDNDLILQVLNLLQEILLKGSQESQKSNFQQMTMQNSITNRLNYMIANNFELRNKIQQHLYSNEQKISEKAEEISKKLQGYQGY